MARTDKNARGISAHSLYLDFLWTSDGFDGKHALSFSFMHIRERLFEINELDCSRLGLEPKEQPTHG